LSAPSPLNDGVSDKAFVGIFRSVLGKVMENYDPTAIVLQCGADSLSGDRLGCFNLSLEGHADCVEFMKSFNKPLLLLGGGGYTMRNVARCWTAETAVALDEELDPQLPFTDYYEYFGPDYGLPITPSNMEDLNQPEYLAKIQTELLQNLDSLENIPSVPFHERPDDMPTTFAAGGKDPEKESDPDQRTDLAHRDSRVSRNEFEDSDDDDDEARGSFKRRHRRNIGPDYSQTATATARATGAAFGAADAAGSDTLMPVWSVSGSAV
jgi:histone deacetylase 1/2